MSERYNTPAEGSLDWHVPLNENFDRLATDVEFRDAESNRDQYQPTEGAKFLATDTGAVYTGDGSQWNYLGDIVPEQSGTGGGDGAITLAQPGEVQAVIDSVAGNGGGSVMLDPNQSYPQPSSPWKLRNDVTLDFNGATLYGTGDDNDTDIVHLYPGAQLYRPRIDLYDGGNGYTMDNSYRGRVFTLDTRYGQYFAFGTTIRNGVVTAVGEEGTACYLGVNGSPPGNAITFCTLNFDVGIPRGAGGDKPAESAMGTALHLDTTGGGDNGWINSVTVSGNWRYVGTGILQEGVYGRYNQQRHNMFNCTIQPGSKSADAAWRINGRDELFAKGNIFSGLVWDLRTYEYAWKIDADVTDPEREWRSCNQNAMNTPDSLPTDKVRSRSSGENYLNRLYDFSTRTV
jgi:hypothetical protein